ncbi:IS256 family transposase [Glaesserella parasuis]|uniref:IS256 family transposase n=1 Tax=Glaesserella parasuis TaxID=738 RepID=UPI002368351C|nr:IS256 family transposase [Glaesserella parasuis]WDI29467.1 IS256 family transposase [Glaesserella parasuis]
MNEKQLHALAAEFAKNLKTPEDLNQFSRMLKKITVEAALNGELTDHLGYEKHQPRKGKNARNGYTSKTVICDEGEIEIETPRDRDWIAENEGAKFWANVLTELQNRGLKDIFIACVDGLKGFLEAINAVYPKTKIQLCIVHLVRNSLKFVSWKDYKAVTADLKQVYQASTEAQARENLTALSQKWQAKYPLVAKGWEDNWANIATFFDYPADIRKAIYTTNAVESLNSVIRRVIKKRNVFPTDDSVFKVIWLAIKDASKKWTMPIQNWKLAMNRFMIDFGDRLDDHR